MYTVGELQRIEEELGIGAGPSQARNVALDADYARGKLRVLPLPFDKKTLTDDGDVTLTATADRACKPVKIILAASIAAGACYVSGIHVQGINQLLGTGFAPASAFEAPAPSEDLPWDFAVLATGGTMLIDVTAVGVGEAETVYIGAVAKCIATQ